MGTLLGGGETEYMAYSIGVVHPVASILDGDAATTMGADAAAAGFLGLRAGAGHCWGEAWRCAGRGRSGGCGNGLRAIRAEAEFAEKLLKDFRPLSIGRSVAPLPNLLRSSGQV
jgi:hypothetical protein